MGDGQPSNAANGKFYTPYTSSFVGTTMTSGVEFSQGGCYKHKESVRNVTAHTLYKDHYFVAGVSHS